MADAPNPRPGDRIEIDGEAFLIQGEPVRDRERLVWTACNRALEINARSYSSVHSILKNGLESKPRIRATEEPAITHPNIRGADYFH